MKSLLLIGWLVLCAPLVHAQETVTDFEKVLVALTERNSQIRPGDVGPAAGIARTADSLYDAASKVQDRETMLRARAFRAVLLTANRADVEQHKKFYLQLADLALDLGDTVEQARYTCFAGLVPGTQSDSSIKYLEKGCAIVRGYRRRDPADRNRVGAFYAGQLSSCDARGELHLLYRVAHAALADTVFTSVPVSKALMYTYLIQIFEAADRTDSSSAYLHRLESVYREAKEKEHRSAEYILSNLVDSYLRSEGDKTHIIELVRHGHGTFETVAQLKAEGLDHGMEEASPELRNRWVEATNKFSNMGQLFLAQQMWDSAVAYLSSAVELARLNDWAAMPRWGNVELELGQAYMGIGNYGKARRCFEQADSISLIYPPDMVRREIMERNFWRLDSMDGLWSAAAMHLYRATVWADSLAEQAHTTAFQGHLFDLSMQEEKRQAARAQTQVQEEADRQRFLRNAGFAFAGAVLLFLGGLWRQRNRIRMEKHRSDELLLNILPEEVAEELKAKGAADAKLIDHVTVLFTDFKGFTAMSEKLTAKELVADIHECFSAFDRITEKHGIEKIKTIGDAYMAAGGLPSPNTTHALDVVRAAFEIRDFIAEGKARKVGAGLPYFEIRIGIHTGPVVAGIVGVKKFAYDIWGDTVNTASRMESSGEVGQVNISEATYELVKDEPGLTFTPRGKVQAKGKGEMEMYFVSNA